MKSIKFRAWDKKVKEMYNLITWHNPFYLDYDETATGQSSSSVIALRKKDTILMQFTGKMGNCYEGDIVQYYPQMGVLKMKIAYVKWNEIICGFILVKNGKMVGHLDQIKKVVGNIYENKNLLEGDKK